MLWLQNPRTKMSIPFSTAAHFFDCVISPSFLNTESRKKKELLRMAAHYDISTITLIHQTPCADGFVSLQCEVDVVFGHVSTFPDALLVFCGAVATLIPQGKIKAPRHHAVAPGENECIESSWTPSFFFLRLDSDFKFDVRKAKE
jgi:deacetoxycephalosporin-C synthase